jgi:hypothetical protein
MPRFLALCRWETKLRAGGKLCGTYNYGEYNTLEEAVARVNEIADNAYAFRDEIVSYYVNELAPPGVYPVVAKSYPLS